MRKMIDRVLAQLADLIAHDRFEHLETDTLEIKPVPSEGNKWKEIHKSVNAFLNTRGGILILGIKEICKGSDHRYVMTGYHEHAENKLKELPGIFTNRNGQPLKLAECFPLEEVRPFLDGRVAIIYVDELAADQKYCFYKGEAYCRKLTGDHKLTEDEIERQDELKEEADHARELQIVPGATLEDLDLDRLNEYIQQLNRTIKIETIKPDLNAAMPFLERKAFVKGGKITTLGMLVCGKHPGDYLGFRCQVHGYVDIPQAIAQDKQDLSDNILPLMEGSLAYVLRNIQVGVSVAAGGSDAPQYPEELLRETINNALAHRDYSIDTHVIITIKPGKHISIQNPGTFRKNLLIETKAEPVLRRILPSPQKRNPKLADVLRVYRKWEGRGIGMATLVNLCLDNKIDLPYYRFHLEDVNLVIPAGKLLDERMERLFDSFDAYLAAKLNGIEPTENQKLVLSYLMKAEWENERYRHTILLTHDNNHFEELRTLEQAGLISIHPDSMQSYPIYVADRVLMKRDYLNELRAIFGQMFDALDTLSKEILGVLYRFNNFSSKPAVSAKQASFYLWAQQGRSGEDIKAFDAFYRKVRRAINMLESADFIKKPENTKGYLLNKAYTQNHLV